MNILLGVGTAWPTAFGVDSNNQYTAIRATGKSLKLIAGGDHLGNTSGTAITSVLSLATSIDALGIQAGYNGGDEPLCGSGPNQAAGIPATIANFHSWDPARMTLWNQTPWVPWITAMPTYSQCLSDQIAAFKAADIGSFDNYPVTIPWFQPVQFCGGGAHVAPSDFQTVSQDCLWTVGLGTAQAVKLEKTNTPIKPVWIYIESGGDNLGQSSQANYFTAGIAKGSTTITNNSGFSKFTSLWNGLTVSDPGSPYQGLGCIPANTTMKVIDKAHAAMSHDATCTSSADIAYVSGGTGGGAGGCNATANICVPQGNEYRATAKQVNSEVWNAIINGANGIEWFCDDTKSLSFCLGDGSGGDSSLASAIAANLTYINSNIATYATVLNLTPTGICSMQNFNLSTSSNCQNGNLSMATDTVAVPGCARVTVFNGVTYLFAMSDRRGRATMTFKLASLAGKTAMVVYDSNGQYDHSHSSLGIKHPLDATAKFSDAFGANNDDYQIKIYTVQ